jgi:hypothetical protein
LETWLLFDGITLAPPPDQVIIETVKGILIYGLQVGYFCASTPQVIEKQRKTSLQKVFTICQLSGIRLF